MHQWAVFLRKNEQCQRTNYIVDPFNGRRIETVIFECWAPSHTEFPSPFLRRHCTIGHLDLGNTLPKPHESPRPGAATKYEEKFAPSLLQRASKPSTGLTCDGRDEISGVRGVFIANVKRRREKNRKKPNHSRKGTLIVQTVVAFACQESEDKIFHNDACQGILKHVGLGQRKKESHNKPTLLQ